MTVWLINAFWDLPQEGNRPQRYWLMAEAFVRAGHRVVYWTSDFSHATKRPRIFRDTTIVDHSYTCENIRVMLLPTRPYRKNISLVRALSHRALAKTFREFAAREKMRPDLIVASTPPLGLCDAARAVAQRVGAAFMCDIQDAWPETFERLLPRWSLAPLRATARRIYCSANALIATGEAYLALSRKYGATASGRVVPQVIAMQNSRNEKTTQKFSRKLEGDATTRLVYCGNMSASYDLATVIDVVRALPTVTLDLAGDGPDCAALIARAADCSRIRFHGYLGEAALANLLASSDAGVIPMFPESCVAMPGKIADYAAANLRVIECLGGECAALLDSVHAGAHYRPRDRESLASAIEKLATLNPNFDAFRAQFDGARVMDEFVQFALAKIRCDIITREN